MGFSNNLPVCRFVGTLCVKKLIVYLFVIFQSTVVTKYRPGSCENCGAMTHQKRDCMERPRKVGAKFTGIKIGHDEFIQPDLALDFDGKRDRWAGYDPSQHKAIVEEYQKIEEAKRTLRAEKLNDADELVCFVACRGVICSKIKCFY